MEYKHMEPHTHIHKCTTATTRIHGKHMCRCPFENRRVRNNFASGRSSTTCVSLCLSEQVKKGALWDSHHVLPAAYIFQPDRVEHRSIHLSPILTPLGCTSSPLSIIRRQGNYGLESEPPIVWVMHGSWAASDKTGLWHFSLHSNLVIIPSLLWTGKRHAEGKRDKKIGSS